MALGWPEGHKPHRHLKTLEIIQKDYSPEEWNIYLFYYSDGENFTEDNDKAQPY